MDLSIIIVNYNTKELLKKCLFSIVTKQQGNKVTKQQSSNITMEIIIVDNGSEEKIKNQISKFKNKYQNFKIKLIENKENLGFSKANNQAIQQAQGEYILLLNPDTEVIENGVEQLLSFMKANKKADIAGGKLFNRDKTVQPSCGPFYSLSVCFLLLFLKGDKLGLTRWSPQKVREVDWVSGACLMAKRSVFEKLSFDENIFMYMDEIEFLYRAKKAGFKVFFYPQAKFFHLGAGSSQTKKTAVLNIYQGLLYFYQKHHSNWRLSLLKLILKTKARATCFLGKLIGNNYLKETYEQALALVK